MAVRRRGGGGHPAGVSIRRVSYVAVFLAVVLDQRVLFGTPPLSLSAASRLAQDLARKGWIAADSINCIRLLLNTVGWRRIV